MNRIPFYDHLSFHLYDGGLCVFLSSESVSSLYFWSVRRLHVWFCVLLVPLLLILVVLATVPPSFLTKNLLKKAGCTWETHFCVGHEVRVNVKEYPSQLHSVEKKQKMNRSNWNGYIIALRQFKGQSERNEYEILIWTRIQDGYRRLHAVVIYHLWHSFCTLVLP